MEDCELDKQGVNALSWIQRSALKVCMQMCGMLIINHNLETMFGSLGFSFLLSTMRITGALSVQGCVAM